MSDDKGQPYLSVVVTSRNDDHGGTMLRRMQAFVNALIGQCRRFDLPSELIIVEWNPPADRPRLADALSWPADPGPCRVRLIEVSPKLHERFDYSDRLPLFQMIAKNVGIRRARGEYVLATNIDVLLNDDLMRFLSRRDLKSGRMYRIDRTDVGSDVPVDAPVDEQLAYCRENLLRVNAREGVFPLEPDGVRGLLPGDIADAPSGFRFDDGWYPVEQDESGRFRWSAPRSTLLLRNIPPGGRGCLYLDVEAGPGVGYEPFHLSVSDHRGRRLFSRRVVGLREVVAVPLKGSYPQGPRLTVEARSSSRCAVPNEVRELAFRVFGCAWSPPADRGAGGIADVAARGSRASLLRRAIRGVRSWLRREDNGTSPAKRKLGGEVPAPAALHFGAPGDFTLMARRHWLEVRGHAELAAYSLHIDTLLCYQAHYAGVREVVLPDPMRLYHIEHGSGSGWTPEGQSALMSRMAERGIPVLDGSQLMAWAGEMARDGRPTLFNGESWGLAEVDLPETVIKTAGGSRTATAQDAA